jgi:hypothetical protein
MGTYAGTMTPHPDAPAGDAPPSITVDLTPAIYARIQQAVMRRVMKQGANYPAMVGAGFALTVMIGSLGLTRSLVPGIVCAGAGVALLLAVMVAGRLKMRNYLARMGACFYGEFTFTLEPDGLRFANDYLEQRLRYHAFVGTDLTRDLLMIFTGETAAYGLPVTDANRVAVEAFHRDLVARLPASAQSPKA